MKSLGIFDSGIGGLTVLRQLLSRGAYDRIVYFGDTARVPYGSRARDTIIRYAEQDVAFLCSQQVDEIIVACGTVSANALEELRQSCGLPIAGVIDAAAEKAAALTRGTVGVIGTAATVQSDIYRKKLAALKPEVKVLSVACPLFVPLVENGFFAFENDLVRDACRYYLQPLKDAGVDTLILGCTHYPLLKSHIDDFFGHTVTLIDQGEALAETIPAGPIPPEKVQMQFFVSDAAESFAKNMGDYLPQFGNHSVKQISIL